MSMLKAGLVFADRITTVSPTYAREIRTPQFGAGLEGVINSRAGDLTGLLNGLDAEVWNPATDTLLPANYSAQDLSGKAVCRHGIARSTQLGIRLGTLRLIGRLRFVRTAGHLAHERGGGANAGGYRTGVRDASCGNE